MRFWIGIAGLGVLFARPMPGRDEAEVGVAAQVAVVVNPGSNVAAIGTDELRRLYLGATTKLPDGSAAVLFESARHAKPFLATLLGMSEDRFKRHWVGVLFAGDNTVPPRVVEDVEELKRLIAAQKGAIGFLGADQVDATVKVIAVGGRRPGDAGYLFPNRP